MKKYIFSVFTLLIFSTAVKAQGSFSHAVGLSIYGATNASGYAGTYSPRYNFLQMSDEATLSIGSHASLGFSLSSRSGGSLTLDLPAMLEINLGNSSSEDSEAGFGGFAGAGFGYSMLAGEDMFGGFVNNAFGPILGGGLRFDISERSYSLRGTYLINVKSGNFSVLGLGLSVNL